MEISQEVSLVGKSMKRLENPRWQKQNRRKKYLMLIYLIPVSLLIPAIGLSYNYLGGSMPEIPNFGGFFSGGEVEINGNKIYVRAGMNLQAAINKARPGDTLLLQAGATFKGNFKLPKKNGDQWITIRSSASDSQLPPPGTRLDPTRYANLLPKLKPTEKGSPTIETADGAHHYRMIGIEFMPTVEGLYNIVQIGSGEENNVGQLPHHIEIDRSYIHGNGKWGQRRGVAANGRYIKIVNSHISNIRRDGEESQAIAMWAADGPLIVDNNYLEAAAMGILFGGAGSNLKLIPTDCVITNNHINKPLKWRDEKWLVKNLFEIKNGRNIRVQNNLMTNNWAMGQDGTAILFTTRADNSNAEISNILFEGNIIRGSGGAVNVMGAEGNGGRRLIIRNNIFQDINGGKWGGQGIFLKVTTWNDLQIENNTVEQTGNITLAYDGLTKKFEFINNVIPVNEYGFIGDGVGSGVPTLNTFFPGAQLTNNVLIGGSPSDYGRKNIYPKSFRQLGLDSNLQFPKGSVYLKRGTNGKPVGAVLNIDSVGRR